MTGFAEVAADALMLRQHIPPEHWEAYDRLAELAMRQAILPEVEELADLRPLADVVELLGYSRKTNGAA